MFPFINFDAIPEGERPHAGVALDQLIKLGMFVDDLVAAVKLFDFAETAQGNKMPAGTFPLLNAWQFVAARDGAMTLYHFLRALQAVKRALDNSPAMRATARIGEIDKVLAEFNAFFPDTEGVRNSVAHTAELTTSPKRQKSNVLKEDYKGLGFAIGAGSQFVNNLSNRTFVTTTFGGVVVKYDVTQATADKVRELKERVYVEFPNTPQSKASL